MKLKKAFALLAMGWGLCAWAGSSLELNYTEGVVAYQKGQYDEAKRLLDAVLKEAPGDLKALELKGLTLKEQGKTEESLEVFQQLRSIAEKQKATSTQIGSYDFQAAVLLIELKRGDEAKPLLENAIKLDFNTAPAKYFLGLLAMQQGRQAEAQVQFRSVVRSNIPMLRASSFYYLGVIAKQESGEKEANLFWAECKKTAQAMLAQPDLSAPLAASAKALIQKVEGTSRNASDIPTQKDFFANITLLTSYDSNVLLNAIVNIGASGNPTVMETARYAAGYDIHVGESRISTALRGSINYNTNPAAHGGQFWVNDLSMTYTHNPKHTWNYGIRAGAMYIFRNDTSQSTDGALKPQSLGIPIAPFVRRNGAAWKWMSELSSTPQQFFTDVGIDASLAKTGFEWHWRNQWQYASGSPYLNPQFDVDLAVLQTNGGEYRNRGLTLGVGNAFFFSRTSVLALRATAGYQEYPDRPTGARYDSPLTLSAQYENQLWKDFFLVSELSFTDNLSNITSIYRYVRLVASVGLDCRF